MVSFPRLKTTFAQGKLIAKLLHVIGSKEINDTSYVYEYMREYIPTDLRSNLAKSGKILTDKEMKKYVDQEHSRAKDYCEAFDLISEQKSQVMLTFFGLKLVRHMDKINSEDIFEERNKDLLSRIYLEADKHYWGVTDILSSRQTHTKVDDIIRQLRLKGFELGLKYAKRDQIRKRNWANFGKKLYWQDLEKKIDKEIREVELKSAVSSVQSYLRFLVRAGLIEKEGNSYSIDEESIRNLKMSSYWNDTPIKRRVFERELRSSYSLWASRLKLQDVPIPYLRYSVCDHLDITWRRFDEILRKLGVDSPSYSFVYSVSRFPEKWGVELHGKNMYYLQIIPKGG